ncbi:MAG: methyltransferase domain-containing protein [Bdellovibrionales bacterium]
MHDFQSFYNSRLGLTTKRILKDRICDIWGDCKSMRVMGCGYAVPYLKALMPDSERCFALMPAEHGAHFWAGQSNTRNLAALSDQYQLPIETNSVDRALVIHTLEHSEDINQSLSEIWRVLKSNGRILAIVPNRSGFWVRSDKNPFGQGRPFSTTQLCNLLRDNQFIHERTEEALFIPPTSYNPILKVAPTLERIGRNTIPFVAGVHIVEASKQLYARADRGSGSAVATQGKRRIVPKPAISSRS